jgi:hypothetical protein
MSAMDLQILRILSAGMLILNSILSAFQEYLVEKFL